MGNGPVADGTEVGFVGHVGEEDVAVGNADGPGNVAVGSKTGRHRVEGMG